MEKPGRIVWPELTRGILIKRYKRFLADVRLTDDRVVTAHCPNSGAMTTCCESGQDVYLSYHDNPRRKLKYTWEMIQMETALVGVNTQVPNRLVSEAISAGIIDELSGYDQIRREIRINPKTRLDVFLNGGRKRDCYVEIKNCTLVNDGLAAFPDAVTTRGLKHLNTLCDLVAAGNRGVIFYLVQRSDATRFKPADDIDPAYGQGLRHAAASGVEILVYDVDINLDSIGVNKRLDCLI
jgi:sugar fermentation stimulation protein A